ncbi:MAG: hypothetical protein HF312_15405 [Ignavibacteria bacterium]|jgi:antitoxin component YwqK of YwqJK toxin-antitoxin module|nr:hypothetical protein [Ignavibacteria bacterium]
MAAKKIKTSTPSKSGESVSLSIRKIENGYVVREETYKNGRFKTTETFSKEMPAVTSK